MRSQTALQKPGRGLRGRVGRHSKKMVSRIALNQDKELIYVSVLYPNNHKNLDAEKKECVKYIDYINILFSMFTEPRKEFIYGLLY